LGIPMCQPIEFGTCEEGVYSLQGWIEGKDARDAVDSLSEQELYDYGCESGKILRKIHSIKAPDGIEEWEPFFNRKMNRKIENYKKCPLKYENGDAFIAYIEKNRHLLKNRPLTYQHGDYHIGNLMIDNEGNIVVIDFNRNFASGMVDGYFDNDVPKEFWDLLALYISSNTLSSLPWAIPFGDVEIEVMKKQAKDILGWYDGMKNTVPKWYAGF